MVGRMQRQGRLTGTCGAENKIPVRGRGKGPGRNVLAPARLEIRVVTAIAIGTGIDHQTHRNTTGERPDVGLREVYVRCIVANGIGQHQNLRTVITVRFGRAMSCEVDPEPATIGLGFFYFFRQQ